MHIFLTLFHFSDVNKYHEGIGEQIGAFFLWTTMFVSGLTAGFVLGWKLAVVVLAFVPLLAICGFIMNKVCFGNFNLIMIKNLPVFRRYYIAKCY